MTHFLVGEHRVPYQADRPIQGREVASCLRRGILGCPSCSKGKCLYSGQVLEILQATAKRAK